MPWRVERDLPHAPAVPGVVDVLAVGVGGEAAAAQDVEQVGVELDLLLVRAAADVDPPEHVVPALLRGALDLLEVPARQLGLQVAGRAVLARERERDLHLHGLAAAQMVVAHVDAHLVGRQLVDRLAVVDVLAARPAAHRVERLVERDLEVQLRVLAALVDPARQAPVADPLDVRVVHVRLAELAGEVDDDVALPALLVAVAVHADAVGRGQLGVDAVAVEVQPVIARLGDLVVVVDVRLPAGVALGLGDGSPPVVGITWTPESVHSWTWLKPLTWSSLRR